MPAKTKYLTKPFHRFLKTSAGILGGYQVASAFHLLLAALPGWRDTVLLTSTFTLFIVWIALMILAFLSKNGWKIWGIYLFISIVFHLAAKLLIN